MKTLRAAGGAVWAVLREQGPRDLALAAGWAMVTVGAMARVGVASGMVIGGACLFLTAVFGIASTRGS